MYAETLVFQCTSNVRIVIAELFLFKVEVMMEGIIQAFKDRVSGVGWIDKQTVEAVREKVTQRRIILSPPPPPPSPFPQATQKEYLKEEWRRIGLPGEITTDTGTQNKENDWEEPGREFSFLSLLSQCSSSSSFSLQASPSLRCSHHVSP